VKRVSDYTGQTGKYSLLPRKALVDVLDKELVVWGIEDREGRFGDYLVIACSEDEDATQPEFVLLCGGGVVLRKLRAVDAANGFPVKARFTRPGRYYDVN